MLAPEFSEDEHLRARFEREARSTARLEHPNIVQVLELGATEEGFLFIVMQLLDGEDLSNFIAGPLDPLRAVEFQLQILRALEHAHRQGVVHRDLKPDNVFVTRDDDGNEVLKLLDFGIAKLVNPRGHEDPSATPITQIGLVFGTPQYMSPEQATGMETDARTDIYSAGLILYALLTGAPPFDGDDLVAVTRMQVSVDPPPLPDTLPEALRAFVSKMIAKDRDQRYQSAEEARLALETMVVTPKPGRTLKCLFAAAIKAPVLTPEWVLASIDAGRALSPASSPRGAVLSRGVGMRGEEDDEEDDDQPGSEFGLFDGKVVSLSGDDRYVEQFGVLLRHAGAEVLSAKELADEPGEDVPEGEGPCDVLLAQAHLVASFT